MSQQDQYVLGYRTEEQKRLQQQAAQLAPESSWLFDQVGSLEGCRVVEIGCGPHGCLDELSRRVGKSGSVTGVERSSDAVMLARQMIASQGLHNVEVREVDARSTGLPRGGFDFVTARLVLVNIPRPHEVVMEAVALARPGGLVAFHEADWISHFCDPPSEAWTSIVDLFVDYSARNGIDPFIGRKVPRLLREAGVTDVQINPIVHIYPPGHERRSILLDFAENLTQRVVSDGMIQADELGEIKTRLAQDLADPRRLVVSHLFFQVWGRKPS
ncbi:methyltransferase domain-containing protein [Smaragdicoccus niigatensis]|uniref:methyltransferase domain-containing protein n=1 Tax=Smaragdicoccus niigatensis TaxID=359359 RepID=UPI00058B2F97|nr:methyltransferase domain-containing protein [Smaragdicoccus niigatensis]